MSQYRIPDAEELLECPYDRVHMVRAKRFQYHLMKCRNVCFIFFLSTETFNSVALRTAKTLWSFGHSECNRVKQFL